MTRTRTFVLSYHGGGWFKRLYAGRDQGKVRSTVDGYRRAGWTYPFPEPGSIVTVDAGSFAEAVEALGAKLPTEEAS